MKNKIKKIEIRVSVDEWNRIGDNGRRMGLKRGPYLRMLGLQGITSLATEHASGRVIIAAGVENSPRSRRDRKAS